MRIESDSMKEEKPNELSNELIKQGPEEESSKLQDYESFEALKDSTKEEINPTEQSSTNPGFIKGVADELKSEPIKRDTESDSLIESESKDTELKTTEEESTNPQETVITESELTGNKESEEKSEEKSAIEIEYESYIKDEFDKFIKNTNNKNKLCEALKLSSDITTEELYDKYMNFEIINKLTIHKLFIGLFKKYDDENIEEFDSYINILHILIRKYGIDLLRVFSLKFLLKPGILFKETSSLNTEEELAITVKNLFITDKKNHASLLLVVLLLIAENHDNIKNKCDENIKIKSILYKLDDDIVEQLLKDLFSGEINLLTYENKSKLKRLAYIIYKSASEKIRRSIKQVEILPFDDDTDELCKLDDSTMHGEIKEKITKKTLKRSNPKCLENENNLISQIKNKSKVVIDQNTINFLERCHETQEYDNSKEKTHKSVDISTTGTQLLDEKSSDDNDDNEYKIEGDDSLRADENENIEKTEPETELSEETKDNLPKDNELAEETKDNLSKENELSENKQLPENNELSEGKSSNIFGELINELDDKSTETPPLPSNKSEGGMNLGEPSALPFNKPEEKMNLGEPSELPFNKPEEKMNLGGPRLPFNKPEGGMNQPQIEKKNNLDSLINNL